MLDLILRNKNSSEMYWLRSHSAVTGSLRYTMQELLVTFCKQHSNCKLNTIPPLVLFSFYSHFLNQFDPLVVSLCSVCMYLVQFFAIW